MKNRDLIRDAMMFAVKDITGRVLREATVQSMIDDFEKQLNIPDVVKSFFCDIDKGTRCKDSFPDYKDGKCRICGGQAN